MVIKELKVKHPYLEAEEDSFLVEAAERLEIPHLHEEQRHLGLVQLGLERRRTKIGVRVSHISVVAIHPSIENYSLIS